MTEPHTPTTDEDPALEEVRGWYIDGRRVHNPFASDAALVERFDRWLAQHDAEVAAKALRDAADDIFLRPVEAWAEHGNHDVQRDAEAEASSWLDERAARLASGGEGA